MQEVVRNRIEAIRARVGEERKLIAQMNAELGKLRTLLETASSGLTDVELFFLGSDILKEPRDAAQWDYWLTNAESTLQRAIDSRKHVQTLAAKFGTNVKLI